MNIYLVSQTSNRNYDTYDSFVAIAATAKKAKQLCPCNEESRKHCWTDIENVKVVLLGTADTIYNRTQIICSSFNAG